MIAVPAARMVTAPNDDDPGIYLATVTDSDTVVAAALHGGSGGVLLTAAPQAAVRLIALDVAERGRTPTSAVGPLAACEAFARVWREQTGQAHTLRFHLRHFELTGDPVHVAAPGELRLPESSRARSDRRLANGIHRGSGTAGRKGSSAPHRRTAHRARACPRLGPWGRRRVHRVRRWSGGNGPHRPGIYAAGLSWPGLRVSNGGERCRANCSPRARVRYF